MNKFKTILTLSFCILLLTGCEQKKEENQNNHDPLDPNYIVEIGTDVNLEILNKSSVQYTASEKKWTDFEWLKDVPAFEPSKIKNYDFQEGDFLRLTYDVVSLEDVKKWADLLFEYGWYQNDIDHETESIYKLLRRSNPIGIRADISYNKSDNTLNLYFCRIEYEREVRDARFYKEHYLNK